MNRLTTRLPHSGREARAGFTALELLLAVVVLSVVAMLALPTLQKIRQGSHSAACLAHIRAVGNTLLHYAAENNQDLVPTLASDLPWSAWLDETGYLKKSSWNDVHGSVMHCPARDAPPRIVGGSSKLHYAMSTYPGFNNTFTTRKPQLKKLTAIKNPAQTFLLGETEAWYSLSKIASNAVYPHARGMHLFFADGHCERFTGELAETTPQNPYPFH